jgi:hypothetical protein
MSTLTSPLPPPRSRARPPLERSVTHGADPAALDRPAAEFLQEIPWRGCAPDPDELPAPAFLRWL